MAAPAPTLERRGREFLADLDLLAERALLFPSEKLPKLRTILEAVCKDRLPRLPSTTLMERVRMLAAQHRLPYPVRNGLHALRIVANKVLHDRYEATLAEYHAALLALYQTIEHIYGVRSSAPWLAKITGAQQSAAEPVAVSTPAVPFIKAAASDTTASEEPPVAVLAPEADEPQYELPAAADFPTLAPDQLALLPRRPEVRALVQSLDAATRSCVVLLEDDTTEQPYRVRYTVPGFSDAFGDAERYLRPANQGCPVMVNLLDVVELPDRSLMPAEIVLAPDYLFEVTSLAECFLDTGPVQQTYLLYQLMPPGQKSPLARLQGTIVNQLFDSMVRAHALGQDFDFDQFIQTELFLGFPFEFAFYFQPPANNPGEAQPANPLRAFLDQLKRHAQVIGATLRAGFVAQYLANSPNAYRFQVADVFLESSFFSTRYGIQGRADLLHTAPKADAFDIVELKSGAPPPRGARLIHQVQAVLYNRLLESAYGRAAHSLYRSRILYSKGEAATAVRDLGDVTGGGSRQSVDQRLLLQQALHLRNRLAALEFYIAREEDVQAVLRLILQQVGQLERHPLYFVADDATALSQALRRLDATEQHYYASFVRFGIRERILTKVGADAESARGQVALWQTDKHDPNNYGVLTGLTVAVNGMNTPRDPYLVFRRQADGNGGEVNFRRGDQVVAYPQMPPADNADTNTLPRYNPLRTQVFRGSIDVIERETITVRFRAGQHIAQYFENQGFWALEQDVQDSANKQFLQPLTELMMGPKARRDLLLGRTPPRAPDTLAPLAHPDGLTPLQQEHLARITASPDYHLIIGPPGTGKTSIYLRSQVREFLTREPADRRLLLLAFTNRAVDEICEQLEALQADYIRIGSRQTTPEAFHHRLLNALATAVDNPQQAHPELQRLVANLPPKLKKRQQLKQLLEANRITVATLAALATRSDLLQFTPFHTAIVDEASQLVEPPLLRVLMHVQRFVLIGDDRQLPAVVQQPPEQTAVPDGSPLRDIDLTDLRSSYFERLLNRAQHFGAHHAVTRLKHQGRMHQAIADFPGRHFYGGHLYLSERDDHRNRQTAPYVLPALAVAGSAAEPMAALLAQHRLLWIDTLPNPLLERRLRQTDLHAPALNSKTNWAEAAQVVRAAQWLAACYRAQGVDDEVIVRERIGIIAPYRNQIAEIRRRLEATADPALAQVVVDTVERYQGSQRWHILASLCTNATYQLDALVSMHADGQTDRKLNVLLTRAREQLVLVGASVVLTQHPVYQALFQHIAQNGYVLDATDDLAGLYHAPSPAAPSV